MRTGFAAFAGFAGFAIVAIFFGAGGLAGGRRDGVVALAFLVTAALTGFLFAFAFFLTGLIRLTGRRAAAFACLRAVFVTFLRAFFLDAFLAMTAFSSNQISGHLFDLSPETDG